MKEIKDVDGTSDKVSSVRNGSQQAFNPRDFPFVLCFPLSPPLSSQLSMEKASHGVGLSS